MVPEQQSLLIMHVRTSRNQINQGTSSRLITIVKNRYHKNQHRREVKPPKACQEQKPELHGQ